MPAKVPPNHLHRKRVLLFTDIQPHDNRESKTKQKKKSYTTMSSTDI